MTFLAPAYLAVAGGLAALAVALHFIVTREPATVPLPTARFAPARPVQARARALQLRDLALLLCRAGLILAAGAALAQPIPSPRRRPLARIVMVDRSSSVADPAAAGDSARALMDDGDALVPFDSAAATGSISAALILALRTAGSMRREADSFELAMVSAFGADQVDQATDSIRALWPGAIRLVTVAPRPGPSAPAEVSFLGGADDPLRYALPPARGTAEADVRIVRGTPGAGDTAWAGAGNRALVLWPVGTAGPVDTAGAVSAGDIVVVAPFARGTADTLEQGRVVARWVDGLPAAVEVAHGSGCIRTVEIPVSSSGDLVLDPRFQRLASRLAGRCGSPVQFTPLESSRMAALAGAEMIARVPVRLIASPRLVRSPVAPWLLAAALALGLGELMLRRRRGAGVVAEAPA